uniref:Hexose transporter 1 n=1 Tax=Babesia bovis TaxID=5865 RepID=S6B368_BABBO|nr:hexose transporter [Babesia bovis]
MRSYFVYALALGALVAFNFGLNTVSFVASREFAVMDLGWCTGEAKLYECSRASTYSDIIAAGTFIGGAVGSLLIGYFAKFGRRKGMLIIHIINVIGSCMSTAASCFTMFLLGRLIAGVSVGASGVVAIYLSEICTNESRGKFGIVYPLFICIGQFLMVAWQLLHGRILGADGAAVTMDDLKTFDKFVWRMAQFWPVVFSIIAVVIMVFIVTDDTPYVLLNEGKEEEARSVISKLHGEENADAITAELKADIEAQKANSDKLSLLEALKVSQYRKVIFICCGLGIVQQFSGINIFVANASTLFISIMGRTVIANVMGLIGILCLMITMISLSFFIEKFGRKTLLLAGILVSSVFMVPAVIIKIAAGKEAKWAEYIMVTGCMGFMVGFAIGLGGVMWLYLAEAMGAEYKDAGFGLATCANWLFAAIVVTTSGMLIKFNENFTYALYAGFGVLGFVYVTFLIKETKDIPLGQAYA